MRLQHWRTSVDEEWALLRVHEHPDGMTVDEIHDELRDGGWRPTVYRAPSCPRAGPVIISISFRGAPST